MLSSIKQIAHRIGIAPYLETPYSLVIQRPYWWMRRRFGSRPLTRTIDSVEATFVAEHAADANYYQLDSERLILEDLLAEVRETDVFFDVGANIGIYSCFLSQKLTEGEVIAFEPSPPAYEKLERNAAVNGGTVRQFPVALSDVNDEVEFAVDRNDSQAQMSTLNTATRGSDYDIRTVSAKRADDFVRERGLPLPTVVKIDVEGTEYDVLRWMTDALDATRAKRRQVKISISAIIIFPWLVIMSHEYHQ